MATAWLVRYLVGLSNRVSPKEGLANLQRAIRLVSAIKNPTPEVGCHQDGSPGQFVNCLLLLNRAFSFSMICRFVPPAEVARYADLGLADIELIEPQLKKLHATKLMIGAAAHKADLYKNKASLLDGTSALQALETSRLLFLDLITHLSAYPSMKNQRMLARTRYAFSGVLIDQSVIDTNRTEELAMDALEQLSGSLSGCPENVRPSGMQAGMYGRLRRIRRRLGLDSCLLDDYVWADAKTRELLAYAVLAGGAFDDGSVRGDAERSFQAANRVFSKDIDPLSWANNQFNLAMVLFQSETSGGDQPKNSCDLNRRVEALLKDADAVFSFQITPSRWKMAKITEVQASLLRLPCASSEQERRAILDAARRGFLELKQVLGDQFLDDLSPAIRSSFSALCCS